MADEVLKKTHMPRSDWKLSSLINSGQSEEKVEIIICRYKRRLNILQRFD